MMEMGLWLILGRVRSEVIGRLVVKGNGGVGRGE